MALKPLENPQHDLRQVASIYRNLSQDAADQVVARALGELALSMATLAQRVAAHQLSDLQRGLQRLDRMAQNLGLKTLSVVTQDLAICLNRKDNTAFAAVWARLLRIADSALTLDALAHDIKDF